MGQTNNVTIEGNLTRDPERIEVADKQLTKFSIANNRRKEKVSFFNVEVWGQSADICARTLHKGSRVNVEGWIEDNEWTGKDGTTKKEKVLKAREVSFLSNFDGNQL